jgi:alkylated DNA repair dioxygenase AlkB
MSIVPSASSFFTRASSAAETAMRLDRRSVYLMRGPSRDEWKHSIPAVDELRYSITFRSMRDRPTTRDPSILRL